MAKIETKVTIIINLPEDLSQVIKDMTPERKAEYEAFITKEIIQALKDAIEGAESEIESEIEANSTIIDA